MELHSVTPRSQYWQVTKPTIQEEQTMKTLIAFSAGLMMAGTAAFAQAVSAGRAEIMTSVPANSVTVTDWYKQNVYDPSDNKIGEVMDVLMTPDGHASALIVGVGGFLGAGEKDVAVPFSAVKHTMKDKKVYLTMDTTKDALKAAPGLKYDRERTSWVPDTANK
jgi:sporulation protein YlmC with PRC-barrel domain